MRPPAPVVGWPLVGALGVCLLVVTRVQAPDDVGAWAPAALQGEVVLAVDDVADGVLVGTRAGLHHLGETGGTTDLGVRGPVRAVAHDGRLAWIGTDDGVLRRADGRAPAVDGLAGVGVHAIDVRGGEVVVGAQDGVHRRTPSGRWERVWPAGEGTGSPVAAVLGTRRGVLFAHPDGLAVVSADGAVEVVRGGVTVLALGRWPGGRLWAGTRGGPLLLVSADEGRSWAPRATGLGFSALHAVAADPAGTGHLVAGGSGLADGTGNAGTQRTDDDGRTWRAQQDRLSNSHVYAVAARVEPLRLSVGLSGTTLHTSVRLPATTSRWYAGTNGGGVSSYRPDIPVLTALTRTGPYLRLAEPLVAGAALLLLLLPVYRRLARGPGRRPRSPPAPEWRRAPVPAPHPPITGTPPGGTTR